MQFYQYLILLSILILGFLLNFRFRIKNKFVGSDCWFHLMMSEEIRKNNFKMPKKVPFYILGKTYDYPPLIHYIFSIIPRKYIQSLTPYAQQCIDIINKLLIFTITYTLFNDYFTAILALIIYSTTVISSQETVEPNPRPLGTLFYSLYMLTLYSYTITKDPMTIIISIFFIILMCLSHRFAVQTALLTTAIISLYFKDTTYIITFILGILTAIFITKGHYITILTSHIKQLHFWRRVYRLNLKKGVKAGIDKNIVYLYESIISSNWDLYIIILLLIGYTVDNQLSFFILWILIIRLISFMVLTFKKLKFIGEGQRYLAYSVLPSSIILSHILKEQNNPYLWIIFFILVTINILGLHIWQKTFKNKKDMFLDHDSFEVFEKIKKLPEKKILVLPNTFSRTVAYFCRKNVISTVSPKHFKHLLPLYWNIEELSKIVKRHKPQLILIMNDIEKEYDLSFSKKIFKNKTYSLYKIS